MSESYEDRYYDQVKKDAVAFRECMDMTIVFPKMCGTCQNRQGDFDGSIQCKLINEFIKNHLCNKTRFGKWTFPEISRVSRYGFCAGYGKDTNFEKLVKE